MVSKILGGVSLIVLVLATAVQASGDRWGIQYSPGSDASFIYYTKNHDAAAGFAIGGSSGSTGSNDALTDLEVFGRIKTSELSSDLYTYAGVWCYFTSGKSSGADRSSYSVGPYVTVDYLPQKNIVVNMSLTPLTYKSTTTAGVSSDSWQYLKTSLSVTFLM